jgi:hypothetical protein
VGKLAAVRRLLPLNNKPPYGAWPEIASPTGGVTSLTVAIPTRNA